MSNVEDATWLFGFARIRGAFSRGEYEPFKEYIEKLLLESPVVQVMADGQECVPMMADEKFEEVYAELQKFNNCAMLLGPDLQMLFFGKDFEQVAQRVQDELNLLHQDGHIDEEVTLALKFPHNEN